MADEATISLAKSIPQRRQARYLLQDKEDQTRIVVLLW